MRLVRLDPAVKGLQTPAHRFVRIQPRVLASWYGSLPGRRLRQGDRRVLARMRPAVRKRDRLAPRDSAKWRGETLLDRDDDLATCVAPSEVADRLRNLVEREGPVDDGPDCTGREQVAQLLQVTAPLLCDEEAELLADEG
jgi:hypothetical protein